MCPTLAHTLPLPPTRVKPFWHCTPCCRTDVVLRFTYRMRVGVVTGVGSSSYYPWRGFGKSVWKRCGHVPELQNKKARAPKRPGFIHGHAPPMTSGHGKQRGTTTLPRACAAQSHYRLVLSQKPCSSWGGLIGRAYLHDPQQQQLSVYLAVQQRAFAAGSWPQGRARENERGSPY